jgi:hypothetical protein
MILQQEMHPDHGNYTTSTNIQKYINRHIFMLVNIRIMNMHHIYINHSKHHMYIIPCSKRCTYISLS